MIINVDASVFKNHRREQLRDLATEVFKAQADLMCAWWGMLPKRPEAEVIQLDSRRLVVK